LPPFFAWPQELERRLQYLSQQVYAADPEDSHTSAGSTLPRDCKSIKSLGEWIMLGWALTFLVIALIAAVLGFGGVAGTAVGIAKILFFVFIVLFLLSLVFGMRRPVV
jgi:uncharacterized membrane protein YtjA (UPF0391 family)